MQYPIKIVQAFIGRFKTMFLFSLLEKSSPSKKEFRKKPSSISLDLVLQQESVIEINAPVVEIPSVPKEKSVEKEVLVKQSSQEKAKVDVDLHDKPKEEERKGTVEEEEKPVEVVAEPEPKFSKINIGDEPKKATSVSNKQSNTAKKESKMMDHHDFRDDDKRVSSAGSSSSSSSGAELYVGNIKK